MSEEDKDSGKIKLCELRGDGPATVLCSECHKCLCKECSDFMHKAPESKDHKIEDIPEGIKIDGMCSVHKNNPLELFCVDKVKLCCPMCERDKLYDGHKIKKTTDIIKDNEIFSASEVKNRFTDVLKCDGELDKKIELIMETIRNEAAETRERVKQTFNEERKKLDEEEKKIMEELEEVCDGCEEVLKRNLESLRKISEYSQVLNEASSKINEESSRLMELNLVSEMEEQRKAMEELHRMKMSDLKIDWDNEKRKLLFTKTLFNGAPVPNNIKFPVVFGKGFVVSWECDESEMKEEDKPNINHVVEVKKSSDDEKGWRKMYSGKEKEFCVNELDKNTEYDVRVKCVVGDMCGKWSDVVKVGTKEVIINSTILSQLGNKEVYTNKLCEWCRTANFELLYRGSANNFNMNYFHNMCDNKGNTLVLVRNTTGYAFGGFASTSWTSSGSYKQAPGSFLFTLTNMYGIQPTKFLLKNGSEGSAVYHHSSYGPTFGNGHDIYISSNCGSNTSSSTNFPYSYNDTTGKGRSIFSSNTSNGNFQVREIEVFRVNV